MNKSLPDCSGVNRLKFNCVSDCGKCCYYQLPMITTTEINAIRTYLKSLKKTDYQDFMHNWAAFNGRLDTITADELDQMRESLHYFWWPAVSVEIEKGVIAQMYSLYVMPSSGRCRFLDPLENTCFIYPARPYACRLYPFAIKEAEYGAPRVVLGMKNCPGIGKGNRFNKKQFIDDFKKNNEIMLKDASVLMPFMIEQGYVQRLHTKKRKTRIPKTIDEAVEEQERELITKYFDRRQRTPPPNKKLIEPFVEMGMMPKHPLFKAWNEKFS